MLFYIFTIPSFLFGGLVGGLGLRLLIGGLGLRLLVGGLGLRLLVGGLGLRLLIHMVYLLSKQTTLAAIATVDNVDRKIFAKIKCAKTFLW